MYISLESKLLKTILSIVHKTCVFTTMIELITGLKNIYNQNFDDGVDNDIGPDNEMLSPAHKSREGI